MKTPIKAWTRSLPSVIFWPIVIWPAYFVVVAGDAPTPVEGGLVVGLVAAIVHLLSYAIFGLPLFHHGYSERASRMWLPWVACATGILFGIIAFLGAQLALVGNRIEEMNFGVVLIGALYGLWTALCALRFKPSNSEQDVTPNA